MITDKSACYHLHHINTMVVLMLCTMLQSQYHRPKKQVFAFHGIIHTVQIYCSLLYSHYGCGKQHSFSGIAHKLTMTFKQQDNSPVIWQVSYLHIYIVMELAPAHDIMLMRAGKEQTSTKT